MARLTAAAVVWVCLALPAGAQPPPPALTQTVNDFAGIIDPASEQTIDSLVRALQRASGDAVVVATVETVEPYADIQEYAVRMFQNQGRGIGERGRDNGLLMLVAVKERDIWMEVGYDLEEFVTDQFASQVSRDVIAPEFRRGNFGAGLAAGVSQVVQRIAERRNVVLQGAPAPRRQSREAEGGFGAGTLITLFVIFMVLRALGGGRRRRRGPWGGWGGGGWSGWNSGVGPFGGGFRGGGGGGFGGGFGGFGGFGGGRSGGGGGGAGW